MLATHTSLFLKVFKLAQRSDTLLMTWNSKKHRMEFDPRPRSFFILKLKCFLHTLGTLMVTFQTLKVVWEASNGNSQIGTATIFIAGFSFVILIMNTLHLHGCAKQAPTLVQYVNGNLQFIEQYKEHETKNRKSLGIQKLSIMLGYMIFISGSSMPFMIVYGLHWKNPCKPSLAGYWLLGKCNGRGSNLKYWNLTLKILVLLWNHWLWNVGFRLGTFIIVDLHLILAQSLWNCLDTFSNMYRDLQQSGREQCYKLGVVYRQIELLAVLTNAMQQKNFLISLMVAPILVISFCITALIHLPFDTDHVWSLLTFAMFTADSSCMLMVCIGGMVSVYLKSVQVLEQIRGTFHEHFLERQEIGKNSWERKWCRKFFGGACSTIKIKFGGDSYLEPLTPLNCMDFSNGLTVDLLLIDD